MEAKRIFKGQDLVMWQAISDMLTFFEEDQAHFVAQDPSLDAAFLAAWKEAKDNALKSLPDTMEVAEGEGLLEEALTALDKCRDKYKDVKYFAGKAFPDNKEALREFGEGHYSKVRNSPLRMVQFMEALHGVADKYKTELIAKGYTQPAIDEIATLTDELREDNKNQQLKKKERPTGTRKRIEGLNAFYSFGQQVAEVALIVFRSSAAKRKHYRLSGRHYADVPKNWFTLASTDTRKTALPKLLKKFSVTLTNQGKETIVFWQADNIRQTPGQKQLLAAGETVPITAETPAKKFLIVQNNSQKEVRVMMRKTPKSPKGDS